MVDVKRDDEALRAAEVRAAAAARDERLAQLPPNERGYVMRGGSYGDR